jgi:hypothetical protein
MNDWRALPSFSLLTNFDTSGDAVVRTCWIDNALAGQDDYGEKGTLMIVGDLNIHLPPWWKASVTVYRTQ